MQKSPGGTVRVYDYLDYRTYRKSISEIEELTGIDFLTNLTEREQRVLESNIAPMWAYDRTCDLRE
jgi:DNA/RNA endonuclease G (NUC1)